MTEHLELIVTLAAAAGGGMALYSLAGQGFALLRRKARHGIAASKAVGRALEHHDAQSRGVVLVCTHPEHPRSAVPLLQQVGWVVCPYTDDYVANSDRFLADLDVADVVVLQGYSAEVIGRVAESPWFRDALGAGVGVILYTPSPKVRYDLAAWGDGDQATTTPATTEAAVRAAVARRRDISALQGVRPGRLATAKTELLER